MAKDFRQNLTHQHSQHTESILKTKVATLEADKKELSEKIKELEEGIEAPESIDIEDIKLVRNSRNDMVYEDIEMLAKNIKEVGQLQPVLLTKDNYLISGHRRYHAIELINKEEKFKVKYAKLDKNFDDIGVELFDRMQLAENEQRKNLDNFHLSDLFNDYLKKGKKQKDICEIFNKSKSTVSELISLSKMDEIIRKLLKEIQYYGMSKKKFVAGNFSLKDRKQSIIGITPLAKIVVSVDRYEQIKEFINLFGSKLDPLDFAQLQWNKDVKEKVNNVEKIKTSISNNLKPFYKKYTDEKSAKVLSEVEEKVNEIEKLLKKLK